MEINILQEYTSLEEMSVKELLKEWPRYFDTPPKTKSNKKYLVNELTFENKSGLGSSRSLRNRLNALSTKGHIKFFKNADIYGLPQAQRSRQGYICVEDMALGDGTRILPTHFKHPKTNEVLLVDDPENWIIALNDGGLS